MTHATLRRYPYPWRSMLAICSDLDETPDAAAYFEISRFLNTDEETAMGPGVNLEAGNTLYFAMPADQFSYCNATDQDRRKLHALIRSGHIDCLHSFGDLVTTRREIEAIWALLNHHGCRLEVWIDHGVARSNFDTEIMFGEGAVEGAPCYHADITLGNGIRYVWKGRVTSLVAQEVAHSFRGLFRLRHPLSSARTIVKEASKTLLGKTGSAKYAMHGDNRLMRDTHLLSGHPVVEFMRANPSWAGVSRFETGDGIAEVLTRRVLDRLVDAGGASIFYTHLGKTRGTQSPLPPASVDAFRRLAEYQRNNAILVTTTRRLLGYCDAVRRSRWWAHTSNHRMIVEFQTSLPGRDLEGLTWYIPTGIDEACIRINGGQAMPLEPNPPDETGRASASIPFKRLTWPAEV